MREYLPNSDHSSPYFIITSRMAIAISSSTSKLGDAIRPTQGHLSRWQVFETCQLLPSRAAHQPF